MANNNENEATGMNELSEEVAHKIGMKMGQWRMKTITIHRQHFLVLEEYIVQLEEALMALNVGHFGLYEEAENKVYNRAIKQATNKVMNQ